MYNPFWLLFFNCRILQWFNGLQTGRLLTVRDLLSWLDFIKATEKNLKPEFAFLHGSFLVLLDGLNLGMSWIGFGVLYFYLLTNWNIIIIIIIYKVLQNMIRGYLTSFFSNIGTSKLWWHYLFLKVGSIGYFYILVKMHEFQ